MSKQTDEFWNKYFHVYDVLNQVYPYKDLLRTVVSEMDLKHGTLVLDAGTGTGNAAVLIHNEGATVIGVDTSVEGLKIFKKKLPNNEVVLHDVSDLSFFTNNLFDYVCCINTLFALSPRKRKDAFFEFNRILKPGGKIIVTNLLIGYRPINIYIEHIKKGIEKVGYIKILINIVRLIVPTVKMFFYSKIIQKESETSGEIKLFSPDEQRKYLIETGFINISEDKKVFANQAVLNTAFKVI